jgi:hypothetical protein
MSRLSRLALALSIFALASCSGSDTVLVLNVAASGLVDLTRIDVSATRASGSPFSATFTRPSNDAGFDTFFERVKLDGWEGPVHVEAQGFHPDGSSAGAASTDVQMTSGEAVVAFLLLAVPVPDAGTDGGGGDSGGSIDAGTGADASEGATVSSEAAESAAVSDASRE